jgi:hypothetical protein
MLRGGQTKGERDGGRRGIEGGKGNGRVAKGMGVVTYYKYFQV